MIVNVFNVLLYEPFYNGLLFLVKVVPWGDVGIAVIVLTFVVKLVLFSLSYRSIQAQTKLKEISPELEKIKAEHKNDKQKQAEAVFALYKRHNINPLSSFFVLLLQIPALLALYWVFLKSGLPDINHELLYSFINPPTLINMKFLGILDVTEKSIVIGVLAGLLQFIQTKLLMPTQKEEKTADQEPSMKKDLMKSLQFQMKFMMPALIGYISYSFGNAVALYMITSSVFAIGQEVYMKKRTNKERASKRKV
jgi:YidC/Oxa1 family membrane protein insertase